MEKKIGCLCFVIAVIVLFLVLCFGYKVVKAEGLELDGTATVTSSATPKGTSTPFPTNSNSTPGPGSGCPDTYPTNMSASFYRNCSKCFTAMPNPLLSPTPTRTGTLITQVATNTPTPNTTWYGKSALQEATQVTCQHCASAQLKTWTSTNVCGGSNRIVAGKAHFYSNYNSTIKLVNGYQTTRPGGENVNWWFLSTNSGVNTAVASIKSSMGTFTDNWVNVNYPSDTFSLGINPNDAGQSAYFDNVQFVCLNYGFNATPTPAPSPTPTKMCVTPVQFDIKTTMDTFARGLRYNNDTLGSYYHLFPYDVGAYRSLYERDFYNKNFEIDMDVSGATTFEFIQSAPDVNVFYGRHKIDLFDCSNRLIGTYTSSVGNDTTRSWVINPSSSLCVVRVETIDDGLEKQFSSMGVTTNGCDQVSCSDNLKSGTAYKYDKDSPIGIDIGGWSENQCRMLSNGFDLAPARNYFQSVFDWAKIAVVLPEFPNMPWIQICVLYYHMPIIKWLDWEVPIGNILMIFMIPALFRSNFGSKGK